jgi:hypothetical protein
MAAALAPARAASQGSLELLAMDVNAASAGNGAAEITVAASVH